MADNKNNNSYNYLEYISFDKKLKEGWLAKYIINTRLVSLFIIAIVISGIYSFFNLPRRLNPEIKIAIVIVSTALPGASPEDVESLITIPLEDELSGLKDVTKMTSSSSNGFSTIVLEFKDGVDPDKARDDAKALVDNVKSDLPEDATDTSTQAIDFENEAIISFALTSKTNLADLDSLSRELEDQLDKDPDVDRISVSGLGDKEIQILIKQEKINSLNLNAFSLNQIIKNALSSYPAGEVKNKDYKFSVSIDAPAINIEDIRNLRVLINGTNYKLSDIAFISLTPKPGQNKAYLEKSGNDLTESVNLSVYKTTNAEIDTAGKKIRTIVDNFVKDKNDKVDVTYIQDFSKEIDDQFIELRDNFRDTIILVFIVLLIFLGIRQAFIASVTIPLTILNTFTFMEYLHIDLSFLSLFAMILALGLVVDDTIVIISATTTYFRSGKFDPVETGLLVWRDFIIPIWTTTITTIWSFIPLLLASGIIGEFIKPIPIVVSIAMISSTAIAVFITLPLMVAILEYQIPLRVRIFLGVIGVLSLILLSYFLLPASPLKTLTIVSILIFAFVAIITRENLYSEYLSLNKYIKRKTKIDVNKRITHGFIDLEKLSEKYQRGIYNILNSNYRILQAIAAIVIFSLFSYLLVPFGFVKNQFFPEGDSEVVFVNLLLPNGTNSDYTETELLKLIDDLKSTKSLKFLTANVGSLRSSDGGPGAGGGSGEHTASVTLNLVPKEERDFSSLDLIAELSEKYKNYDKGTITVSAPNGGPPAGSDIALSVQGDDLTVLDEFADKIVDYLKTKPEIQSAEKALKPGTSKITFIPDIYKLSQDQINVTDIGGAIRLFASGFDVDSIKVDDKDTDIVIRYYSDKPSVSDLSKIQIQTKNGLMPLASLGSFKLEASPTQINRENQKREITVTADVKPGANIVDINTDLESYVDTKLNLPSGYTRKTGGVNEENQKSINSILQAMVLSSLLILITMVIQFKSYRQAAIVMGVIPLAISGVFIIFALSNTPLSFPALIGVLALFGIVVTHSMVIVDKISKNVKLGVGLKDAVAEGSASRLEPVLLTTLVSIVGLIPITLSDPIWQGLGGAIIAGLTFSGAIMLLFIPVVYYLTYRSEYKNNL